MYELGVSDSGLLVGLTDAEMEQSLATLARMVRAVGAEIGELRERRVGPMARHVLTTTQRLRESPVVATGESVTQRPRESLVTADTIFRSTIDGLLREQQHSTPGRRSSTATSPSPASANSVAMSPRIAEGVLDSLQYASYKVATVVIRAGYVRGVRSCAEEVSVAFLGSTNAGKVGVMERVWLICMNIEPFPSVAPHALTQSTLLGYLSYGELDNGRGKVGRHG